ncbi:hypothetical protein M9458_014034, partial [Cirrhinus mrigala]
VTLPPTGRRSQSKLERKTGTVYICGEAFITSSRAFLTVLSLMESSTFFLPGQIKCS